MKKLKPNKNNIETYLPVFTGFYGSRFDEPNFDGEAEHFNLPSKFDFSDFVKWHEYKEALSKYFCDCVESSMSDFIEIIEFQKLVSPKEYNFTNDSIDCIIRPKKTVISEYIYKNRTAFEHYLEDHLKSRSGFMSFHSYSFETWEQNTKKFKNFDKAHDDRGFNLGFVLSFIAKNEGITEDIFDDYVTKVFVSEYYTPEFWKLVEATEENEFIDRDAVINAKQNGYDLLNIPEMVKTIQKFVRENYQKENIVQLTLDTFNNIDTGFYDLLSDFIHIDKIALQQIKEIEQGVLELKFD